LIPESNIERALTRKKQFLPKGTSFLHIKYKVTFVLHRQASVNYTHRTQAKRSKIAEKVLTKIVGN